MLCYEDVSISEKIENKNGLHHNNTNKNFDSSMVWASPQTKRPCDLKT